MNNQPHRSAIFSPCGNYRYQLARDNGLWTHTGVVLWLMLNPSTADATKDDPTIRRVMDFTSRWAFRTAIVCNLFAWRATNPRELCDVADPIGPENDRHILTAAGHAHRIVIAWGSSPMAAKRGEAVMDAIYRAKGWDFVLFHHLGLTKGGAPRHPLYVGGLTKPETIARAA